MLNGLLLSLAWDTGQEGRRSEGEEEREVKEKTKGEERRGRGRGRGKKEGRQGRREKVRLTFSSAAQEFCIDFTIALRDKVSRATSVLPVNAEKRSS